MGEWTQEVDPMMATLIGLLMVGIASMIAMSRMTSRPNMRVEPIPVRINARETQPAARQGSKEGNRAL